MYMGAENSRSADWVDLSTAYPQYVDEIRAGLGFDSSLNEEEIVDADPTGKEAIVRQVTTLARSFAQRNRENHDAYRLTLDAFNRFQAVVLTAVNGQKMSPEILLQMGALLMRLETKLQLIPADAHAEIASMTEELSKSFKAIRRQKKGAPKFSEMATRIGQYVTDFLDEIDVKAAPQHA
jgi:hypothetical protein